MNVNMRKRIGLSAAVVLLFVGCGGGPGQRAGIPALQGPYLGQTPPGMTSGIFAPGVVSTGLEETVITFMPDGLECYWTVLFSRFETILTSRMANGQWTEPEVAPFSGRYYDGWPAVRPDGKRMFFHSARPLGKAAPGPSATFNIWYVDRTENGWSEPLAVGPPVNGGENATCPSVTRDGTIYLSKRFPDDTEKICRSRFVNGAYQELEILPASINVSKDNFHAYVAPDGSCLIKPVYGRADAIGGQWNYYVSFRDGDDRWSDLVNLGKEVNSVRCGGIPSISADGRFLFFQAWTPVELIPALERKYSFKELVEKEIRNPSVSTNDIYWISAKIIDELRPKTPNNGLAPKRASGRGQVR